MTYEDFTPGSVVQLSGVPETIKDFSGAETPNPAYNAEGEVLSAEEGDVVVRIISGEFKGTETGFLPESLTILRTPEEKAQAEREEKYVKRAALVGILPVVDGAEVAIESLTEYCERTGSGAGWYSSYPYVFVKVQGVKTKLVYNDVSTYRHQTDMRFTVRCDATDGRPRNYKTIRAAAEKLRILIPQYLQRQSEEQAKREAAREERLSRISNIKRSFPEARTLNNYDKHLYLNADTVPIKIEAVRSEDGFGDVFQLGRVRKKLSSSQINRILEIVNEQ